MKIRSLSDLHTEGCRFIYEPLDEDVLVLAGDINIGVDTIQWIKHNVPDDLHVILIAGNHEFYHNHVESLIEQFNTLTNGTNIHFLYNNEIVINDVRFLGSTLWSNFELYGIQHAPVSEQSCITGINDFRYIQIGTPSSSWTIQDCKNEFNKAEKFLQFKLLEPFNGKTVVVTHFTPTEQCVHKRFKMSNISPYFSNNCEHLIGLSDLWICGHTHENFDFVFDDTRIVVNPKGYGSGARAENKNFNPKLIVEI